MLVSALLQSKGSHVVEIGPEAEVRGIADTLRREGIGAVLVRQADGEMLGIVSERDIVRSVAEHGSDALNKSAADLMSRSVVTCSPDNSTEEIMEQMLAERIRHVVAQPHSRSRRGSRIPQPPDGSRSKFRKSHVTRTLARAARLR